MINVLILEDDASARAALAAWLRQQKLQVRETGSLEAAKESISEQVPDLALLDLNLPDGTGLEILEELSSTDCDVVMVSGEATVEAAIAALRAGASDFLPKPADLARLTALVQHVRRRVDLSREVRKLREQLKNLGRFGAMVGRSEPMLAVYNCIERVAPTEETVLITGPTGTGKEVTSATIHELSRRSDGPFEAVNCGAVAANLIESEFFGHERGAFTGADKQHKGVFERAAGGTLFLDEVTEMPIDLQVKLLRVLETRQITRVGGTGLIDIDVRIIAATNRDPHQAVATGKLREDLLYRLLVFEIELPALRDRDGDVALLAQAILDDVNEEYEEEKHFAAETLETLAKYSWPGNVRELVNVVRRAYVMAPTAELRSEHLPSSIGANAGKPVAGLAANEPQAPPAIAAGSVDGGLAVGMSIADAERKLIELTLDAMEGDKRKAADVLGISLKTLYTRLQVYAARDDSPS